MSKSKSDCSIGFRFCKNFRIKNLNNKPENHQGQQISAHQHIASSNQCCGSPWNLLIPKSNFRLVSLSMSTLMSSFPLQVHSSQLRYSSIVYLLYVKIKRGLILLNPRFSLLNFVEQEHLQFLLKYFDRPYSVDTRTRCSAL